MRLLKHLNVWLAIAGSLLLMAKIWCFGGVILFVISSFCGIIYFMKQDKLLGWLNVYFFVINLVGMYNFF